MDIDISEAEGLRLLRFGTPWCQGAMRLDAPDRLELEYAVRMCAWLLFHDPSALARQHLVTLGLGAASLTKFAHRVLGMRATAVEIDRRVIDACRTHFTLPPDGGGLEVVHADALAFMAQPRLAGSIDVRRSMRTTPRWRGRRSTRRRSTRIAAPACAQAARWH